MAREEEDEEAAATTVCFISETERVEGSMIRSLVNSERARGSQRWTLRRRDIGSLSAMPPVALIHVSCAV